MLSSWTEEGQPPDLFWRVTPRVFTAVMQGANQRQIRAAKHRIEAAWLTAKYQRVKRMPKLEAEFALVDKAVGQHQLPEQTPEDMVEVLRSIDNGQGLMTFKFTPHPE